MRWVYEEGLQDRSCEKGWGERDLKFGSPRWGEEGLKVWWERGGVGLKVLWVGGGGVGGCERVGAPNTKPVSSIPTLRSGGPLSSWENKTSTTNGD